MPKREQPLSQRLWEKVRRMGPRDCWPYHGYLTPEDDEGGGGYGSIWYKGQPIGTHVATYIVTHGRVPKGKRVLTCPLLRDCCNPEHIGLGDSADVGDRILWVKGQSRKVPREVRKHLLTDEQVREIFLSHDACGEIHKRFPQVSKQLISAIRCRRKYKYVTDSLEAPNGVEPCTTS